jgi:hypothetical protein
MINFKREMRPVFFIIFVIVAIAGVNAGCASTGTVTQNFQKETAPASTSQTASATVSKGTAGKIEGFEIYENKDPFQPLYGPGSETRTITKTTTTTDTTAGGSTNTTTTSEQVQVKLVAINGATATINAAGTDYPDLKAGDSFGGSFKLLSIGTGSVTILYGDNQYTLYLGETVSVK